MAHLILVTQEGQRRVALARTNSLGRHPNNTIQVLDRIVSKEHCIIEQRKDGYWLRDLGSLNGTFVNGEKVNGERLLRHGDRITMGGTTAYFAEQGELSIPQQQSPVPSPAGGPRAPFPSSPPPANPTASTATSSAATESRQPVVPRAGSGTAPLPPNTPARVANTAAVFGSTEAGQVQPRRPRSGGYRTMAIPAFGEEGSRLASLSQVDVKEEERAIGTQIAAEDRGFLPFDELVKDPQRLRADYERLRLSHELSREIALEHDTTKLLGKILQQIFKFVRADRGVIFLVDENDELKPGASLRRDGSTTPIAVSSTILNHVIEHRAAVLTHNAANDFAASKGRSMILNRISSAIVVPLLHNDKLLGVLWLDAEHIAQFQKQDLEIVTGVAAQAAMFIENNILAKKIEKEIVTREQFSRLLSPNIAERVVSGDLEVKKGGQLVEECTVFNSDIRGFTRMSAAAEPEVIVDMLNGYFELMVEKLFKYEGTLDKFMGDGLMALWGAPIAHPDDPIRAVDCSLEQMQVLAEFNRERERHNQPPLGIGIGIHTGPLVAGYIGSSKSLSYTVIGDTVNTSARLCSHAKTGQILVSRRTYERLHGLFEVEQLEPAKLKGKAEPVQVYNVIRRIRK